MSHQHLSYFPLELQFSLHRTLGSQLFSQSPLKAITFIFWSIVLLKSFAELFSLLFKFWCAWSLNSVLHVFAKQAFYCLSHISSPFHSGYFEDGVS
jgi:fatty-acid desaturase